MVNHVYTLNGRNMKTFSAEAVRFRRTEGSKWEWGIAIGHGLGDYEVEAIIDINFKLVPTPIYTYNLEQNRGGFQFLAENIT